MTSIHRREPGASDRRDGDRRQADKSFEGADRRVAERRSNRDRRAEPRV